MATRVLLHLGDVTNKCIFSNAQCYRTKFQVQNLMKQNRNFRRSRLVEENAKTPIENIVIEFNGASKGRQITKYFLFATAFSGATLIGATILEYERIRSQTFNRLNRFTFGQPIKTDLAKWRREVNIWWNSLTEGQRVFGFLFFANILVYLAWRVPQWKPVMLKYFATNPASGVTFLPMLLSIFSHYNLWHLGANMYVLESFTSPAVAYLGREHYLALYLSSGMFSSACSLAYRILLNSHGYSLGASGAILGIFGFVCSQFPENKLAFIFFPMFTFSSAAALKGILALDTFGCLFKWQFFDHAAHLGGVMFGMFWHYWGLEYIWRQRSPLLTRWHEFRNPPKSKS